jgi:tyrosinase
MGSPRIRYSVQELEAKYALGDTLPLENVIRAFRGIMDKDPKDPDSFFNLAGFHGEPFRGPGEFDPGYWGGYCNHGNVLFPTWHRAYLLRFEDALRKTPQCENVTLPFWDELFALGGASDRAIPQIITTPKYFLNEKWVDNPLFSYRLQQKLLDQVTGTDGRYTKHVGYETVRYPLSGLVGTDAERKATE